jgi:Tol biopolymer transport system component
MADGVEPFPVPSRRARRALWAIPLAALALASGFGLHVARRAEPLPPGLQGALVYVSDRSGVDNLYLRRLPEREDERLTHLAEPAREPALSPGGGDVAFTTGGRVGVVSLRTRDVRFLTLGVDWKDASPSWHPDGRRLIVSARRPGAANADVHLLEPGPAAEPGALRRRPLTDTGGLDELSPVFTRGADGVVFVRSEQLFRLELPGGRVRRLTSGFRVAREPRLLPSGRVLFLWTEAKSFGMDVIDADGRNRETLQAGTAYYRSVAPSPDGRYMAATLTFDLGFHPAEALGLGSGESVRLLDALGRPLCDLARSWRRSNHSPAWGAALP